MTLAEEIAKMVLTMLESGEWSSASPTHTNKLKQINQIEYPDLEALLKENISDPEEAKRQLDIDETTKTVKEMIDGNIGEVQRFTRTQFGNIRGFANNPVQFMVQSVFTKFAKGAGIAALALLFFDVIQFVINELLKPGRALDVRFKRDINNEILAFRSRAESRRSS